MVPGDDGYAQCGGCGDTFPTREQYGHFQSCDQAQNMAQIKRLLREGQARVRKEERRHEKEERSRTRKQEGRERDERGRER